MCVGSFYCNLCHFVQLAPSIPHMSVEWLFGVNQIQSRRFVLVVVAVEQLSCREIVFSFMGINPDCYIDNRVNWWAQAGEDCHVSTGC